MNRLDLYLAGPMRGKPRNNHEAFYEAEERWARKAWVGKIHNPARMDDEAGMAIGSDPSKEILKETMQRDLDKLMKSDGIVMLKGWEKSEGARIEWSLAIMLGIMVFYE